MKRGRYFKSDDCPDWLESMCSSWGNTVHHLLFGSSGWPARTMLGRIMDEGFTGAAASAFVQHHPEVMTGEALEVSCAIKSLPSEDLRNALFAHYVIRKPVYMKAKRLGISKTTYYDRLKDAHTKLMLILNSGHKTYHSVPDKTDAVV